MTRNQVNDMVRIILRLKEVGLSDVRIKAWLNDNLPGEYVSPAWMIERDRGPLLNKYLVEIEEGKTDGPI